MFRNRSEGGEKLAVLLDDFKKKEGVIVLAIPRGGVVTGRIVADALHAPLDVIITKKIGAPGNPEYAVGAVGPKGRVYLTGAEQVPEDYIEEERQRLKKAIEERYRKFRGDKPLPDLKDRIVILVDDGLATGSTMMAAVNFVSQESPKKIIVAVPVAPKDTIEMLKQHAEVVCAHIPDMFYAIGSFYDNFSQVSDEEAVRWLERG